MDADKKIDEKNDKWEFEDYAFTITGVIVFALLVLPDILYSTFDLSILGGSLGNIAEELVDNLEGGGIRQWSLLQLRPLSPLLFLLTTTIVFFHDAIVARKTGGYTGSMFTHTFESLLEEAIYMAITTIMVYVSILFGRMYASWLAAPISWVLFVFVFPLVRKQKKRDEEVDMPWLLLGIFAIGIVAEVVTGAWVAFPVAWLVICVLKLIDVVKGGLKTLDDLFNFLYYIFAVALLALGLTIDFWFVSWAAFPIALLMCWVASKFKRFRKSA